MNLEEKNIMRKRMIVEIKLCISRGRGTTCLLGTKFSVVFVVILACLVKPKKTRRVLVFRIGESVDEL